MEFGATAGAVARLIGDYVRGNVTPR
jgi:hypothetical protein